MREAFRRPVCNAGLAYRLKLSRGLLIKDSGSEEQVAIPRHLESWQSFLRSVPEKPLEG